MERRGWERKLQERQGGGINEGIGERCGHGHSWVLEAGDTPHPGGARKPHHHAASWRRGGLRLRGSVEAATGLSRSHASHCAPSHTPAQHPHT